MKFKDPTRDDEFDREEAEKKIKKIGKIVLVMKIMMEDGIRIVKPC